VHAWWVRGAWHGGALRHATPPGAVRCHNSGRWAAVVGNSLLPGRQPQPAASIGRCLLGMPAADYIGLSGDPLSAAIAAQVAGLGEGDPALRCRAMDTLCDIIDPDPDGDISYEAQGRLVSDDDRTVPLLIALVLAPDASDEQILQALRVLVKLVHEAPNNSDLLGSLGAGRAALRAIRDCADARVHERGWGMLGNIAEQGLDETVAQLCDDGIIDAAVAGLTTVLSSDDEERDYELLEVISNIMAELACRPWARESIHRANSTLPMMKALTIADADDLPGFEDKELRHAVTVHSLVALACLLGRESNMLRVETHHLEILLHDLDLGLRHEMRSINSIFRLRRVPLASSRMLAISELCISDDFKGQLLKAGVLDMVVAGLSWDASVYDLPDADVQTRNTRNAAVRAIFSFGTCEDTRQAVLENTSAMAALADIAAMEDDAEEDGDDLNANLRTAARAALNLLRDEDPHAEGSQSLHHTVSHIEAKNTYDIFISFRVREALNETVKLRDALAAVGVRAYVCEASIDVGEDWATVIFSALESCRLMVVMGTVTYGQKGTEIMATWEELTYALRYKKAIFTVKMCRTFQEPRARGLLDNMQVAQWEPGTEMDEGLVPNIVAMLQKAAPGVEERSHPEPESDAKARVAVATVSEPMGHASSPRHKTLEVAHSTPRSLSSRTSSNSQLSTVSAPGPDLRASRSTRARSSVSGAPKRVSVQTRATPASAALSAPRYRPSTAAAVPPPNGVPEGTPPVPVRTSTTSPPSIPQAQTYFSPHPEIGPVSAAPFQPPQFAATTSLLSPQVQLSETYYLHMAERDRADRTERAERAEFRAMERERSSAADQQRARHEFMLMMSAMVIVVVAFIFATKE
jgi:hypothetical protein